MPNLALGHRIAEPIRNAVAVTDGQVTGYTASKGFGSFAWPDQMTVDLGDSFDLAAVRLLLWDGLGSGTGARDPRGYKYRLLTSTDRKTWTVLFDSGGESSNGWQVFQFSEPLPARYLRVHGLWNSANSDFHVVELEAWDETPPPLNGGATVERVIGPSDEAVEEGDGLPLEKSVDAIIYALENLLTVNDLLNPKPFRELIEQLRLQVSDVSTLERRMGAVRRELVEPVTAELSSGRKYSVGGYWFGLIGGLIGLISLCLYVFDRFFTS